MSGIASDNKTGDIGYTHKDQTTSGDTNIGSGNHSASVGSGNTANTAIGTGNQAGVVNIHEEKPVIFNFPPAGGAPQADPHVGAQAAHDPASHERAPAHSGGPHPDPAVLALQRRLLESGFDPGPLDGVMGPQTEAAMMAEQAAYTHLQHGGNGGQEPHYQGGYEANGYDHGTHGAYGHQEYEHDPYSHGGYDPHTYGAHEAHGYDHGAQGGYGHDGYPHGGYGEHEYYLAEQQGYGGAEDQSHHYHGDYQAADAAYADQAYAGEEAQAAW